MAKAAGDIKNFNMRMRKELWMFLKIEASIKETSMTDIIVACVEKHKKSIEKKLTPRDETTNEREKKMKINYCTYNTRTNIIIDKDLSSWDEAINIASNYPEWCVASNTTEDKLNGSEWANEEFFNPDNI